MEMKSYLKAELARMYFPMLDAPLAMRRLPAGFTTTLSWKRPWHNAM